MHLTIHEMSKLIEEAVGLYEKTAPTVSIYLDDLYVRMGERADDVRLSELSLIASLRDDGVWLQPNYAANRVYKLQQRLGMDTTGHAGF